ncbi:MAG: hypothetical protein JSW03_05290 [Candidatus Eiseniibacteriota bacterium]|nr:MAG: hypothetical protein JSW03_05290 [Candidatus Eisenbacteria bacterium]
MKASRPVVYVFLLVVVALAVLCTGAQAKEEKILILTTTDTRSELIPCG